MLSGFCFRTAGVSAAFLAGSATVAQSFCIDVDRVDLRGNSLLDPARLQEVISAFEGRCLPLAELNDVLQGITLSYVDEGYVSVRAYLPEQDILDGVLEVAVIEGSLSDIRFNQSRRTRWQHQIFPSMTGNPVNLREIEQGLDLIRGMQGYSAEMELNPGEAAGETILDVLVERSRPWVMRLSTNNHGTDENDPGQAAATGQFITSADLTASHLLGWNETWSLSFGKSVEPHPLALAYQGPGTHNASLGVKVPFGRTEYSLSYAWSDYATVTPGAVTNIDLEGWTGTWTAGLRHLTHRDQTSKTYVGATLTRRENENFIAGVKIGVSSRVLSALRLNFSHEREAFGGRLSGEIGFSKGLELFGAEDNDIMPAGSADAQHTMIDASLQFSKSFQTEPGGFAYNGSLRGQYSPDRLYGVWLFNLGGTSSVRGSRETLLSGSSGLLWRNELAWHLPEGAALPKANVQLYGAFDVGHVFKQFDGEIDGGTLSSATIGLRLGRAPISLDVSYSKILSSPASVTPPGGVLLASLSMQF